MPPHAVEGRVEAKPAGHFLHGSAEQIDVAAGIVAAQCGVAETESLLEVVERVSCAAGAAKEHSGKMDGVDALDLPGR